MADYSQKKYALIAATMASFLVPFMSSSINLAIPDIGREFRSTTLLLNWVVTSYLLASAAVLLPVGRLADIVGRKKIFVLGLMLFSFFSLLCALAWSVEVLILCRVMQGTASAFIFATSMAILTSAFSPENRGRGLGISISSVYIGLSLGPVLGGALNHNFGWHSIFYFSALMGAAATVIVLMRLQKEWKGGEGEKFDITGALLYSAGFTAFMYGISSITGTAVAKYMLVLGTVLLIIFIKFEVAHVNPLLNLRLFKENVIFAFSNVAALINYSATFAVSFLLSLHLQVILGLDSQKAGFVLLAQPVVMAFLSPVAGTLSDRIEPRVVASIGMAVTTTALFMFTLVGAKSPLWFLVVVLLVLGTGLALFSSPNSNAIMSSVSKKYYGVASSAVGTMRLSGQTISMAIVSLIMAFYVGNMELDKAQPDMLLRSITTAFVILTVLCFLGIFASLARGNLRGGEKRESE